jgi:type I restriction enzyme R subunit
MRKVFIDKVIDRMDQNQSFFTRVLDDEHFKKGTYGVYVG